MWTRNCGDEQEGFYEYLACKWMCQMLFKLLSMTSKSTAPMLPIAESDFCTKIWGSYWLPEYSAASHPHSSEHTSKMLTWVMCTELRHCEQTLGNHHSTALGSEKTVEGTLQNPSPTIITSMALLSSKQRALQFLSPEWWCFHGVHWVGDADGQEIYRKWRTKMICANTHLRCLHSWLPAFIILRGENYK